MVGQRLPGDERAVARRLARCPRRRAARPTGTRRSRRSSPCRCRPRRRPAAHGRRAPCAPRSGSASHARARITASDSGSAHQRRPAAGRRVHRGELVDGGDAELCAARTRPRRARPGSRPGCRSAHVADRPPRAAAAFHDARGLGQRVGAASGAASAMASRSAKRLSYSDSAVRPPGQVGASRSCQSTTSASRPMTPPVRPAARGLAAGLEQLRGRAPAAVGRAAAARTLRSGSERLPIGVGSLSGDVRAPVPGSVTLCRTTSTGT